MRWTFLLIHSFSIITYPYRGHNGLLPIPVDIRREVGYTLDRLPVHHGADVFTFTPMGNLKPRINLHVLGLWEEVRVPGVNPQIHRFSTQHANSKLTFLPKVFLLILFTAELCSTSMQELLSAFSNWEHADHSLLKVTQYA